MKLFLDWSAYQNAGMGDAYANIPNNGGFGKPKHIAEILYATATPQESL
jgi:hypothetical protein